jgi:V8-like Glu-specific endopeptidase
MLRFKYKKEFYMIKRLIISITLLAASFSFAGVKSICGQDDRVLSFNSKVGRLSEDGAHKGCTATMISNSCAITAGHCKPVLIRAEFNTPVSIDNEPQASDKKDLYYIDQTTIVSQDEGPGKDWAVFKFKSNTITGKLPGTVQGNYDVSFEKLIKGQKIEITGYGRDEGDLDKHFAQQVHQGEIVKLGHTLFGKSAMSHIVDTMGGNSGSSIINLDTQEVVGIHTHGGCKSSGGDNMGTIISKHKKLMEAIKNCLASE